MFRGWKSSLGCVGTESRLFRLGFWGRRDLGSSNDGVVQIHGVRPRQRTPNRGPSRDPARRRRRNHLKIQTSLHQCSQSCTYIRRRRGVSYSRPFWTVLRTRQSVSIPDFSQGTLTCTLMARPRASSWANPVQRHWTTGRSGLFFAHVVCGLCWPNEPSPQTPDKKPKTI